MTTPSTQWKPWVRLSLVALLSVQTAGAALAQGKFDLGRREFESKCAACHGADGKGNGILKPYLNRSPTDLTTAARRNQGVFPIARFYETIEGGAVPAHGLRDMPVWGRDYRVEAGEYFGEVPYSPEAYVRVRILSLIEYLSRLQQP
jgi:mono/diheme cytochrome c family protein